MRSSATAKRRPRANRGNGLRDYRRNPIIFNIAALGPPWLATGRRLVGESLCRSMGHMASNGVTNHRFNNPVGWEDASPLEPVDAFNISVPACRD